MKIHSNMVYISCTNFNPIHCEGQQSILTFCNTIIDALNLSIDSFNLVEFLSCVGIGQPNNSLDSLETAV